MAYPIQLGFQDAASPIIEELMFFHDHALMIVFLISTLVLYIIVITLTTALTHHGPPNWELIEIVWTVLPAIILFLLGLPSIKILYITDEIDDPALTVKATGHQWYWSYEYTDTGDLGFDSYIVPTCELKPGELRLLEASPRFLIPTEVFIRLITTSEDVIHSWAVPSLGLKSDSLPGRLSQIVIMVKQPGLYYGQCSEICGANHAFIPIVIEVVPLKIFFTWVFSMIESLRSSER